MKKAIIYIITILVLVLVGVLYYKYYFVFGEGVKSGYLNYAVEKGYVFKTYEGKLIQEGLRRGAGGVGVENNEFQFSVENERVFNQLQMNSGKYFDLHIRNIKVRCPGEDIPFISLIPLSMSKINNLILPCKKPKIL